MTEIYISVDVETDGPIPGPHSLLSIGAAAFIEPKWNDFDRDLRKLAKSPFGKAPEPYDRFAPFETFSVNLDLLSGAEPEPDTMTWWGTQPKETWDAARKDAQPPEIAMKRFVDWVESLKGIERKASGEISNAVFVGYPVSFDFMFVYWYIRRFKLQSPFGFQGLDIKSYAKSLLDIPFRDAVRRNMPPEWFVKRELTHRAVDDAIDQGILFMHMLEARQKLVMQ